MIEEKTNQDCFGDFYFVDDEFEWSMFYVEFLGGN